MKSKFILYSIENLTLSVVSIIMHRFLEHYMQLQHKNGHTLWFFYYIIRITTSWICSGIKNGLMKGMNDGNLGFDVKLICLLPFCKFSDLKDLILDSHCEKHQISSVSHWLKVLIKLDLRSEDNSSIQEAALRVIFKKYFNFYFKHNHLIYLALEWLMAVLGMTHLTPRHLKLTWRKNIFWEQELGKYLAG